MAGELAQDLTARALACLNGVNPAEVPLPTLPWTPQASSLSHSSPRLPSADTSLSAALSLNLELQAALREEHSKVEKALIESREALKEAHDRLSCKKSVVITSSSDKFKWSRLVDKFFAVEAHPMKLGKRKQTEQELRNKPITWLPYDDKTLRAQVAKFHPPAVDPETAWAALGGIDWPVVARAVNDALCSKVKNKSKQGDRARIRVRTAEECKVRWTQHEMPGVAAEDAVWSKGEDMAIMEGAEDLGKRQWVKIADRVNGCGGGGGRRTPIACLRRFQTVLNTKLLNRDKWSAEEDERLKTATQGKKSGIQWINVARFVGKRNGQQCLCRWKTLQLKERNGVDPSQEKDGIVTSLDTVADTRHRFWTAAEERRLCLAVRALIEPKKVAGDRAGRDAPEGKRQRGPGATSAEVDGKKTVDSKRHVNWIEVVKLMMGTRDSERCREKWLNTMDPSVNTARFWSEAEDTKLLEVVSKRKPGAWWKIERDMADWAKKNGVLRRSDHMCKRRFMVLRPDEYAEHRRHENDRRMYEPRVNPYNFQGNIRRSEITFDDYELSVGSEEEEEDEAVEDEAVDNESN